MVIKNQEDETHKERRKRKIRNHIVYNDWDLSTHLQMFRKTVGNTSMKHAIQLVAHRGGSHLAPQNTLAAFRNELNFPIDAIELDVHMSRDGHAIVFHDYTVEKLTNGAGNILDLDFDYLRSLNAAAHFPGWPEAQQIPMLSEVLNLARGRVQVYIEIKPSKRDGVFGQYPNIVETVVEEIRAAAMLDQVLIISFDWQVLPRIKALEPALLTGALVSTDVWNPREKQALSRLAERVAALGCEWINMDCRLFSSEMPGVFHQNGFKLGVWTVNSLREMRRFVNAGVDSLTSDRPDLFTGLRAFL